MEVNRHNFEENLPLINQAIDEAAFFCIDIEFTGLTSCEDERGSLFDTGEQRYVKLRKSVQKYTVAQLGLSLFVNDTEQNMYKAHTFNFYLFPRSLGDLDPSFLCQSSCLTFLNDYGFNFCSFVRDGVSFVNNKQLQTIDMMNTDQLLWTDRSLQNEISFEIISAQITEWLISEKESSEFRITKFYGMSVYQLKWAIRNCFYQVWNKYDEEEKVLTVYKVESAEERNNIEKEAVEAENKRLINETIGFTKVFKRLVQSKKLLLGHNNLRDLMFMFEKFHEPLPASYKQFKKELHSIFPLICDTKHMVLSIKEQIKSCPLFENTSLSSLFTSLSSDKGRNYALMSPNIDHAPGFNLYKGSHKPHEAGYDAYMCGYVFLKMIHIVAADGLSYSYIERQTLQQYMALTKKCFLNRVNIIRAAQHCIHIDCPDPPSQRPRWLFVKRLRDDYFLQSAMLAGLFSPYGSVDVQILDEGSTALVAASNIKCAKDILKTFYKSEDFRVENYNLLKHSKSVRRVLWSCFAAYVGATALFLFYKPQIPAAPSTS